MRALVTVGALAACLAVVSACDSADGLATDAADAGAWVPDCGGCIGDASPPAEIPSRQSVTFVLENQAAEDRYALITATKIGYCHQPWQLARVEAGQVTDLPLAIDTQCDCGCEGPVFATLHRLAPGARLEVAWDARALVTYETEVVCPAGTWRPGPTPVTRGALQPVAPGHYRFSTHVVSALPAFGPMCQEYTDFTACTAFGPDINYLAAMCQGADVGAEFDLPATGDVVVDVPIR